MNIYLSIYLSIYPSIYLSICTFLGGEEVIGACVGDSLGSYVMNVWEIKSHGHKHISW